MIVIHRILLHFNGFLAICNVLRGLIRSSCVGLDFTGFCQVFLFETRWNR